MASRIRPLHGGPSTIYAPLAAPWGLPLTARQPLSFNLFLGVPSVAPASSPPPPDSGTFAGRARSACPPACGAARGALLHRAVSRPDPVRSEEHTSELQSLMRISYAAFSLTKHHTHT